jgi:ABC-2 type transport system permease protein
MMVISDGDVAANFVKNAAKKEWLPLGFNRFENATYSNKDLMLNAIEYLIEADGVIEARTKEVKLRLLDNIKAQKEKTMWQLVNILVPLAFLGLFGWLFMWWRRRKYAA